MIENIRVKLDYFLFRNFWRIPLLSYETKFMFDFPTKRLVKYCLDNFFKESESQSYKSEISQISHMYVFDNSVTKENLELIHLVYDTHNRERVRQILCKFVRQNYNVK